MVRSKFFREVNQFWRHKILGCAFAQNTNERFCRKRGLSTVVTTLLIVLFSIIAIGIVWVIVSNIISETGEDASKGGIFIDFDIKSVKVNPASIDIKVKRNSGSGDITGLKFLVSDGVNSQTFEEETPMDELSEKTFTLPYSGLVKEVSIAPVFKGSRIGPEVSKYEFTNKEIIKNLGGVSWWRFEGNGNDELGGNHGTLTGGVDCDFKSKYGKACSFDGVDDYIIIENPSNLPLGSSERSIFARIKTTGNNMNILEYGPGSDCAQNRVGLFVTGGDTFFVTTWCDNFDTGVYVNDGNWHFVGFAIDSNTVDVISYIDGVPYPGSFSFIPNTEAGDLIISSPAWARFNGLIDEVMIFNKALSEDEVKALYELDLS